ncbi:MAG: glycosyltransferase family 4 protein [Candidatus Omnitrophica bacterium]|nr:glycosyltransferase family 4 protein [Candidatus Omnitrophota bacterium]MDD5352370.1 glycosyltransferase family 4 protein [Candidatus Omnitrophota bacterium]MDD5549968.1 glycosyltransferase family 4 protein [Candidatus Omnitrophota bacterium]
MKILIIHNRYQFEGGEEAVISSEVDLLKNNGHRVILFELSNEKLNSYNIFKKILLPFTIIWSVKSYKKVRYLIKKEKPDIVHVHNTFFLMSPSVYYACRAEKVPIVQTLHNYRFICPLGILYRDGKVCRECLDKGLLMSIKYKCGRKSIWWAMAMLAILKFHYKNNTFKKFIDTYIALSSFSKQQFVKAGFDAEKIKVKPNFISFDPGISGSRGNFALNIGRFSPEKGTDILLEAWKQINYLPLKIIGTGYQSDEFKKYANEFSLNIEFLGQRAQEEVITYMKKSMVVILPSRCNENFPRIIVESFACGIPIIASRNGALAEIIEDKKTGLLFEPGDINDLVAKVESIFKNRQETEKMGKNARLEFENKYTLEKNYKKLIDIYTGTIKNYQ